MRAERAVGVRLRSLVALGFAMLLAACGQLIPPTGKPPPPPGTALAAGLFRGPDIDCLRIGAADAAAALVSFRESCPRLMARTDASQLTGAGDWKPACETA